MYSENTFENTFEDTFENTLLYEPSYTYIIDNIYVGNVFSLQSNIIENVEQIISLVNNPFKKIFKNVSIHEILFDDNPDIDIIKYAEETYEILKNNKKTLIHCNAGKSRSVSCVIYYLMKKYNMSFEDSYKMVENKRPCIDINIGFYFQLSLLNK